MSLSSTSFMLYSLPVISTGIRNFLFRQARQSFYSHMSCTSFNHVCPWPLTTDNLLQHSALIQSAYNISELFILSSLLPCCLLVMCSKSCVSQALMGRVGVASSGAVRVMLTQICSRASHEQSPIAKSKCILLQWRVETLMWSGRKGSQRIWAATRALFRPGINMCLGWSDHK